MPFIGFVGSNIGLPMSVLTMIRCEGFWKAEVFHHPGFIAPGW
jgi:hypothetical protein